jgi:hypothetical protein
MLEETEYHFYAALSRAAWCAPLGLDTYAKHQEALGRHDRRLRAWAANCPQNFEDRAALVGAEIAHIEGRALDAMDLYERAIAAARANGFVHNEALAYELAARFYAARGFEEVGHLYLGNARRASLRWGADGKVRQLDQLHPPLRQHGRGPSPSGTIETTVEQLDLATVLKVSQAVSGEMVLEKLIDRLMRAAIEQAGERLRQLGRSVTRPSRSCRITSCPRRSLHRSASRVLHPLFAIDQPGKIDRHSLP